MKTYEDFNIHITSQGEEVRSLCPSCSATRKKSKEKCLAVNTEKGTWFCHHCGHSGGLSEKTNLKPKYQRPEFKPIIELPKNVVDWFSSRGICLSIIQENKINYGPVWMPSVEMEVNAIQFPYFKNSQVVNIKYRDGKKNFRQAKGAEKCFYRFDFIGDPLIITEGEIDALSFVEAGYHKSVSCPDGAPPENAKHYGTKFDFLKSAENKLKDIKKIILSVDNDRPGKILEEELARRLGKERCWRVTYPEGCKDGNDVLVKFGKDSLKQVIENATPFPIDGLFCAEDLREEVIDLYENGQETGLSTGWKCVDKLYTVRPGEMTIVTGIPGSGKSNFVDSIMVNMAEKHDWSFAVFSPENWPIQRHIQTLLEKIQHQPFFKDSKLTKKMDKSDIDSGIKLMTRYFNFIMPENDDLTVDNILAKAKMSIFRSGIKGLVIDPWNEVEHNYYGLTETQYISRELTKIRRFARLNGVHIWVVAHPRNLVKSDDGTYKIPTMYEISGGANWRNKADNGICVHRTNNHTSEVKIIIQKIRFRDVGKIGETSLFYQQDTGEYYE